MRISIFTGMTVLFLGSKPAAAEEINRAAPFSFGVKPQGYGNLGVTAGASSASTGGGGYLGLECSYIRVKDKFWTGIYADAAYDFGQTATTLTLGPKLGMLALGFDGGLGLRNGVQDEMEIGFQARTMITFGIFSTYYRYGGWPSEQGLEAVHQGGVLLKMPFALSYDSRPINP